MKAISSKMSEDLIERIDAASEEGESRSATVRRLIRTGLEYEDSPDGILVTYPTLISFFGWMFVAGAFIDVSPIGGYLGTTVILAALAHTLYLRFTE